MKKRTYINLISIFKKEDFTLIQCNSIDCLNDCIIWRREGISFLNTSKLGVYKTGFWKKHFGQILATFLTAHALGFSLKTSGFWSPGLRGLWDHGLSEILSGKWWLYIDTDWSPLHPNKFYLTWRHCLYSRVEWFLKEKNLTLVMLCQIVTWPQF